MSKQLTVAELHSLLAYFPGDARIFVGDAEYGSRSAVKVYFNKSEQIMYLEAECQDVMESQNIIWPVS